MVRQHDRVQHDQADGLWSVHGTSCCTGVRCGINHTEQPGQRAADQAGDQATCHCLCNALPRLCRMQQFCPCWCGANDGHQSERNQRCSLLFAGKKAEYVNEAIKAIELDRIRECLKTRSYVVAAPGSPGKHLVCR